MQFTEVLAASRQHKALQTDFPLHFEQMFSHETWMRKPMCNMRQFGGEGGGVPDWWGLMGKSQGLDPFNF